MKENDFNTLVELVKSFPEVEVLAVVFEKDESLLPKPYLITAGEWPQSLKQKIQDQFPEVWESWVRCPIYPDEKAADAEIYRQRANQEPMTAPLFLSHDLDHNGDTG